MKQLEKSIAPALQNGLNILELLASSGKDIGFNAIATHLGVSKATTSRLLTVLRHRNYIVKDEQNGRYRPGSRMSLLNRSLPLVEVLRQETTSVLESLRKKTSNTVLFIFWNGRELQCLNKKIHQGSVPMQPIGTVNIDLASGPWGWLVHHSLNNQEREISQINIAQYPNYKAIFSRWEGFFSKYDFCYDDQELYPPLRRLSAPVYDHSGTFIGALGIGGNPLTIKDDQVLELGEILIEHSKILMEKIEIL